MWFCSALDLKKEKTKTKNCYPSFSDNRQVKQFVWWRQLQDSSVILPAASNLHWGKEGRERTEQENVCEKRRLAYLKCAQEPGMAVRTSVPVFGSRGKRVSSSKPSSGTQCSQPVWAIQTTVSKISKSQNKDVNKAGSGKPMLLREALHSMRRGVGGPISPQTSGSLSAAHAPTSADYPGAGAMFSLWWLLHLL